nr:hypothetical protein [Tanacetum cinerariifolium]
DYTSAITPDEPVLSTEEPDNSLSMGDEHLDTIPATESDEVIKSSVENLIPIPKISSGSTTTPPDISLLEYEDFYDDHVKEISSGKYDCFLFKVEPNSRDFTKDVVEDISPTKEP